MGKYVIFDIDGTLNRTHLYALEAYKEALLERKIQVEDKEIISCIGLSPKAIVEKFFGTLEGEALLSWQQDIKTKEFALMETKARAFDGMDETLQQLKKEGFQLAICSNAFPEHINHVLTSIGLLSYFDFIGSLEMGTTKVETLNNVLATLKPEKACMVGDRIFDVEAARANGIPVVGCGYGYAPEEARMADITVSAPIEIIQAVKNLL